MYLEKQNILSPSCTGACVDEKLLVTIDLIHSQTYYPQNYKSVFKKPYLTKRISTCPNYFVNFSLSKKNGRLEIKETAAIIEQENRKAVRLKLKPKNEINKKSAT